MKLSELLYAIENIAKKKGLSKPYIVGGLPRDRLLNNLRDINDVDITTGDHTIHILAEDIASRLSGQVNYDIMPDGHSTISIGDIDIDFSSNFKVPGIGNILRKNGIQTPTEMQKELYSRDFTCNAALMSLDMENITDPTGLAINDIKNRVIKTCLHPDLTFGYDNRRIIRAVYLSAKLDFNIDPEIINWVKSKPDLAGNASDKYLVKKLNKSIKYNLDRTIDALDKMNIWSYIPPIKELSPYMVGK